MPCGSNMKPLHTFLCRNMKSYHWIVIKHKLTLNSVNYSPEWSACIYMEVIYHGYLITHVIGLHIHSPKWLVCFNQLLISVYISVKWSTSINQEQLIICINSSKEKVTHLWITTKLLVTHSWHVLTNVIRGFTQEQLLIQGHLLTPVISLHQPGVLVFGNLLTWVISLYQPGTVTHSWIFSWVVRWDNVAINFSIKHSTTSWEKIRNESSHK